MSKITAMTSLRLANASDTRRLLPLVVYALMNEPHMVGSDLQRSEVYKMASPWLPTLLDEGHSWLMTNRQGQVLSFLLASDLNSIPSGSYKPHILAFKNHRHFGTMETIEEELEQRYRSSVQDDRQPGHTLRTLIGGTWPEFQGRGLYTLITRALITHGGLLGYRSIIGVTTNFRTLHIAKGNGAAVPFEVSYEERFPNDPLFCRCIERGHRKASLVVIPLSKKSATSERE